eukprot:Colp12_sorted_trinity150504_noHs@346
MDNSVIHAGWLNKQGHFVQNWKRRYVVLRKNGDVTYYEQGPASDSALEGEKLKGSLNVKGWSLVELADLEGHPYSLTLTAPEGGPSKSIYRFAYGNFWEMKKWFDSFVKAGAVAASDAFLTLEPELIPKSIEEYVWENQRYFPLVGWSDKLLPVDRYPWSDETGFEARTLHDGLPSADWVWQGDWRVDMRGDVDQEGWQYSTNWQKGGWNSRASLVSYLRQRVWTRSREIRTEPYIKALLDVVERVLGKTEELTTMYEQQKVTSRGERNLDEGMCKNVRKTIEKETSRMQRWLGRIGDRLSSSAAHMDEGAVIALERRLREMRVRRDNCTRVLAADNIQVARPSRAATAPQPRVWGVETEQTRNLNNEELVQMQRNVIEDQDKGLDTLLEVLKRQAHVARRIGDELDSQNKMLDDLTLHVEKTGAELNSATRRATDILRRA